MDINAILENEDDLLGYTCLFKSCSVFKFLNYEPLFDSLQQNLFFQLNSTQKSFIATITIKDSGTGLI